MSKISFGDDGLMIVVAIVDILMSDTNTKERILLFI